MIPYLTEPPDLNKIFKRFNCFVDGNTVAIDNEHFNFTYNTVDILKEEYKDKYRYFGGIQSNYEPDSEYENLITNKCVTIAEYLLGVIYEQNYRKS